MQINQGFIVYMLYVSLSIYIFSRLNYKIKEKINSQIAFSQRLKKSSLTLYAV